jgi:hypothetical protein
LWQSLRIALRQLEISIAERMFEKARPEHKPHLHAFVSFT